MIDTCCRKRLTPEVLIRISLSLLIRWSLRNRPVVGASRVFSRALEDTGGLRSCVPATWVRDTDERARTYAI